MVHLVLLYLGKQERSWGSEHFSPINTGLFYHTVPQLACASLFLLREKEPKCHCDQKYLLLSLLVGEVTVGSGCFSRSPRAALWEGSYRPSPEVSPRPLSPGPVTTFSSELNCQQPWGYSHAVLTPVPPPRW